MTIAENFGKFKATLEHDGCIGSRSREVELDVQWVSCGVYEISYYRPRDAEDHRVLVAENWYPPDTSISFTPEQFEKVVELYPNAPKHQRDECYKPFYEDYDLCRGMFDLEYDMLFQAFKDPHPDVEKVYMVNRCFVHGVPTTDTHVLGLSMEDFQHLKELIESKKDEIFYSGCKIAGNLIDDLRQNL